VCMSVMTGLPTLISRDMVMNDRRLTADRTRGDVASSDACTNADLIASDQLRRGIVDCNRSNVLPLCVDLDGTLVAGDSFYESLVRVVTTAPQRIPELVVAAMEGKSRLTAALARHYDFDPGVLPYREEVLVLIERQRTRGGTCFLVTASAMPIANRIATHLGCFDSVFATVEGEHIRGVKKAASLESRFGIGGFEYVGDSRADIPCWAIAAGGYTVTPTVVPAALAGKVKPLRPTRHDSTLGTWCRSLRVHQWAKNLIVFLPVLASHTFSVVDFVWNAVLAFIAFCMTSSAVYLFNDVCDIPNDRAHERKKHRPVAAGAIGIPRACMAAAGLLASVAGVICFLPEEFAWVLAAYVGLTIAYSLMFKKLMMLDVVVLAALYILRMFGGHAATGIAHSVWLTTFALFLFFSLALLKRATELRSMGNAGALVAGRGYAPSDLPVIEGLGIGASLLSVLVVALYVRSPDVVPLYRNSMVLLTICPVILYWVGRLWILERRGEIHHDPVVFALRDTVSHVVTAVIAGIVLLATVWP
jgi:4-hydroxybenzoate polyprenyltransferase